MRNRLTEFHIQGPCLTVCRRYSRSLVSPFHPVVSSSARKGLQALDGMCGSICGTSRALHQRPRSHDVLFTARREVPQLDRTQRRTPWRKDTERSQARTKAPSDRQKKRHGGTRQVLYSTRKSLKVLQKQLMLHGLNREKTYRNMSIIEVLPRTGFTHQK